MAYACKISDCKLSFTGLRVEFMLYSIHYTPLLHGILVVSQSFNIQWKLPSARDDFLFCLQHIQKLLQKTRNYDFANINCTNLSTQNPQQRISENYANYYKIPILWMETFTPE